MRKRNILTAGVIGFAIIAIATLYFRRDVIETDLTSRAQESFAMLNLDGVSVDFNGRDGLLEGVAPSREIAGEIGRRVADTWGVRVVENAIRVVAPAEAAAAEPDAPAERTPAPRATPSEQQLTQMLAAFRVHFGVNSTMITHEGQRTLEQLALLLKKYAPVQIDVRGHADATGNVAANKRLSLLRAKRVRDFLVEAGVRKSTMQIYALAADTPVSRGQSESALATNRRVDFSLRKEG